MEGRGEAATRDQETVSGRTETEVHLGEEVGSRDLPWDMEMQDPTACVDLGAWALTQSWPLSLQRWPGPRGSCARGQRGRPLLHG